MSLKNDLKQIYFGYNKAQKEKKNQGKSILQFLPRIR